MNAEAQVYGANLDHTLKELQRRVSEHEDELQRLRSQGTTVSKSPVDQAKAIKTALENVSNSAPVLPSPGSILPALLALRRTRQTITDSKVYLESQGIVLDKEKRQREADNSSLRDQHLLSGALTARIEQLNLELTSSTDIDPDDALRKRRDELKGKKKAYDRQTKELLEAMEEFIDKHLAAMLAAEELGGPIVGDMMDIESGDLASGFTGQGKPKKSNGDADRGGDKRQRRIDEIWGNQGGNQENQNDGDDDEVAAAGRDMKQLLQMLMRQLEEAKGDNSASYVTLERESAAARFLVRSKIAQFHPKDATRLRLIDFGRELDA